MMRAVVFLFLTALLAGGSAAFAPSRSKTTFQTARVVPGARMLAPASLLHMAEKQQGEDDKAVAGEKPAAPTSGTFYDDEVEPAEKEGISDAMKQRLMREATTGLDSEKKQTNVLLYIIAGVALLVILGGQGIFY